MKSLKAQNHYLSQTNYQLRELNKATEVSFCDKIFETGFNKIKPNSIDVLQINLGKMCNQVCKHCHVDAGPDRKEIMTKETMRKCLEVVSKNTFKTVDLTGGAPEMNPNFRWFVEELSKHKLNIIVRCNLTIIVANKKYNDLPLFFKKNNVEVVSSLPHFSSARTNSQRGNSVFEKSIKALKMLNDVGYGKEGSGLILNLVYNPTGAILPSNQEMMEKQYKKELIQKFNIVFNHLFMITNMPISRFLDFLLKMGYLKEYMQRLVESFNPLSVNSLMCKDMISVSWDGYLFDCDFNQMLDMKVKSKSNHINSYNSKQLKSRKIQIDNHCYGCTSGSGSSCGGQIV